MTPAASAGSGRHHVWSAAAMTGLGAGTPESENPAWTTFPVPKDAVYT